MNENKKRGIGTKEQIGRYKNRGKGAQGTKLITEHKKVIKKR